ncbi:hypothetical protein RJ641_019544 [Dillenia turbinata]|uniref:Uncharacterized protein n=1 Tax=Dillenia turbinata TaxID=194707 RepID=A0AAN8Z0W6_9MAGN
MDWVLYKRRGPEWKHGWAGRTMASISMPPLPLLAIFTIVIFLLSMSQYSGYKAQLHYSIVSFQLLPFLIPILLLFLMASISVQGGRYVFRIPGLDHDSLGLVRSSPSFPHSLSRSVCIELPETYSRNKSKQSMPAATTGENFPPLVPPVTIALPSCIPNSALSRVCKADDTFTSNGFMVNTLNDILNLAFNSSTYGPRENDNSDDFI